jgi:hypothetical protein
VHIGYVVRDLALWRARLERAGVRIQQGLPVPGHDRFERCDLFGNRIETQQV